MNNDMGNSISNHILSTSSNLLGICFVMISIIRISGIHHRTFLDRLTSIAGLLFLASSLLSYASIRSIKNTIVYEKWADLIFISGLIFLSSVSIVMVLGFIV